MKSKRILFHADLEDIKPIIENFERQKDIQYQESDLFDSPQITIFSSLFEIHDLGFVKNGDWIQNPDLLIFPKDYVTKLREIPQRKGGIKYALDQIINERTIRIVLGGTFTNNTMIAWSIDTTSSDPISFQLFDSLANKIRKNFSKIGAFYVGNNAKTNLLNGWRLVTNDKSPKEYDLSKDLIK